MFRALIFSLMICLFEAFEPKTSALSLKTVIPSSETSATPPSTAIWSITELFSSNNFIIPLFNRAVSYTHLRAHET